jgi:hypothetical protein
MSCKTLTGKEMGGGLPIPQDSASKPAIPHAEDYVSQNNRGCR